MKNHRIKLLPLAVSCACLLSSNTVSAFTNSVSDGFAFTSAQATTSEGVHTPDRSIDGYVDSESRWSGQGSQSITFDIGSLQEVDSINLWFHKSNTRWSTGSIETSANGSNWSLANTLDAHDNDFIDYTQPIVKPYRRALDTNSPIRYIRFNGTGNSDNNWNSLAEARWTPADNNNYTRPVNEEDGQGFVAASATTAEGVHTANRAIDGYVDNHSRWSGLGAQAITLDTGAVQSIAGVNIWYHRSNVRWPRSYQCGYLGSCGDVRKSSIQTSEDGITWSQAATIHGDYHDVGYYFEVDTRSIRIPVSFKFTERNARYIRIFGTGNSQNNWNSIAEVRWLNPTQAYLPDHLNSQTPVALNPASGPGSFSNTVPNIGHSFTAAGATDHLVSYVAGRAIDGFRDSASRWQARDGDSLVLDAGSVQNMQGVYVWLTGANTRSSWLRIESSQDASNWSMDWRAIQTPLSPAGGLVYLPLKSSGNTRYIRLTGFGNSSNNRNYIREVRWSQVGDAINANYKRAYRYENLGPAYNEIPRTDTYTWNIGVESEVTSVASATLGKYSYECPLLYGAKVSPQTLVLDSTGSAQSQFLEVKELEDGSLVYSLNWDLSPPSQWPYGTPEPTTHTLADMYQAKDDFANRYEITVGSSRPSSHCGRQYRTIQTEYDFYNASTCGSNCVDFTEGWR